jgi:hypothetical protein
LGIVLLEALACGLPVVATRCGGPEGLIDNRIGRLVKQDDTPAFAAAVIELLSDPQRLAVMREACVRLAESAFSWNAVQQQLDHALQTVRREPAGESSDRGLRGWVGAAWAIFILAAYLIKQIPPRWPAIQSQIIEPLLRGLR